MMRWFREEDIPGIHKPNVKLFSINARAPFFYIGTKADERTPLHHAAEDNRLGDAKALLEQKADVDAKMCDEGTPIFDAVAMGHDRMVSLLLDYKANPHLTDDRDWNLLHWAVSEDKFSTAQLLIQRCRFLVNKTKFNGLSPLHLAAGVGNIEMVKLLVENGADPFKADDDGNVPIHQAFKSGHIEIVHYLADIYTRHQIAIPPPIPFQEIIERRMDNILDRITLDGDYYFIQNQVTPRQLNTQKWKTYLYLRKCVLDYRRGQRTELLQLLNFLEASTANKKWLADRLLDHAKKVAPNFWGSGSHEWLERTLIVDVLRRSAGMVHGVEAETSHTAQANIDWLYVQAQLRSPTCYLFFKLPSHSIKEGHIGAVKPNIRKKGFASIGSPQFHSKLEEAFDESTTLAGFIIRIRNIFITDVISGKKHLSPDSEQRYVIDGSETDNAERINKFRKERLRLEGYNPTNYLMKWMTQYAAKDGLLEPYSASPIDSDASDDEKALPSKLIVFKR